MKKLIHVFIAIILLSSCGTLFSISGDMMKINEGMSMQEVTQLLGNPKTRSFENGYEEWRYVFYSLTGEPDKTCIVRFDCGRVSGMDTFVNVVPPPRVIHVENRHH